MTGEAATITRGDVEDFLFEEAAALDEWRFDDWLAMLAEDAVYQIPPNDRPDGVAGEALFIIADDATRIRARVKRLRSPGAHAERPRSRTRRSISNVRIVARSGDMVSVAANFIVHRFRQGERIGSYVGRYAYDLRLTGAEIKISRRVAIIDSHELGQLGSVSFIL